MDKLDLAKYFHTGLPTPFLQILGQTVLNQFRFYDRFEDQFRFRFQFEP